VYTGYLYTCNMINCFKIYKWQIDEITAVQCIATVMPFASYKIIHKCVCRCMYWWNLLLVCGE